MLIREVIEISKQYFNSVEQLAALLGDNKVCLDAAEILLFLKNRDDRRKVTYRKLIEEMLYLEKNTVDRALKFLKQRNLIVQESHKIKINKSLKSFDSENIWSYITTISSLDDWYKTYDNLWAVVRLIVTIHNWLGLSIPESSRRLLVMCLCRDCPCHCSYNTAQKIKKDLLTIKSDELQIRYDNERYEETLMDLWNLKKKKKAAWNNYRASLSYSLDLINNHINIEEVDRPQYIDEKTFNSIKAEVKNFKNEEELKKNLMNSLVIKVIGNIKKLEIINDKCSGLNENNTQIIYWRNNNGVELLKSGTN